MLKGHSHEKSCKIGPWGDALGLNHEPLPCFNFYRPFKRYDVLSMCSPVSEFVSGPEMKKKSLTNIIEE
jgi:hypothetical protein